MNKSDLLPQIAIGLFIVSILWPEPNAKGYVPSVMLFIAGIGGIPFAFVPVNIFEVIYKLFILTFAIIIPNILMFMATYKFFFSKAFKTYFMYLMVVCIFAVSIYTLYPIFSNYIEKYPINLIMLVKLGGVIAWYISMLLITAVLVKHKIKKHVKQS